MKYILFTEFGEILDLGMQLQDEGHEVSMFVQDHESKKIGDGILPKVNNWWKLIGKEYTWIFDGCENGNLQDWLREQGESVFGGTEATDRLENNRQLGQALFKKAGFKQTESKNFKDFPSAIEHVRTSDKRWVMKQNGNAPKSLNHIGKFDNNSDMLHHLQEISRKWNVAEYGPVDFDLMEVAEGLEVAASAFFNGTDWLRNEDGKVVGYLNFEDKKETDGNTGETTGEMGTTFTAADEDNKLFKDILLRPEIEAILKETGYRGVFDINCIKTKDGIVALEPTSRLGVPATSYELIEGLDMKTSDLIQAVANEEDTPISIKQGTGMVMVIAAKPYPVEAHIDSKDTSLGEKLWILKDGKPVKEFSDEQKKHIHLENFEKDGSDYRVATGNGYLLTVTRSGDKTISQTRDALIQYIKDNLYIAGMKYRSDIGARVEEHYGMTEKTRYGKQLEEKDKELKAIKESIRQALNEQE